MKRNNFILVIFALVSCFFSCAQPGNENSGGGYNNPNAGKVKVKHGINDLGIETVWEEYAYQEDGGWIQTEYGYNGTKSAFRKYKSDGKLLLENTGDQTVKYTYDAKGNKIKEEVYPGGAPTLADLKEIVLYSYDNNNRVSKMTFVKPDGQKILEYTFVDAVKGIKQVRKRTGFDFEKGKENKETGYYEYDQNGNLIREEYELQNGELDQIVTYEYDNRNNLIERSVKYKDWDSPWLNCYTYNADNTVASVKWGLSDSLIQYTYWYEYY